MDLFVICFMLTIVLFIIVVPIVVAIVFHKWLNPKPFCDKAVIVSIVVNVILLTLSWPVGLISSLLAAYKLYKKHQEEPQ